MKKFENLGRKLSKNEQKKILGGNPPGSDCPTGEFKYDCCLEWVSGSPDSHEDSCGSGEQAARVHVYEKHPNLLSNVTCSLY